jgi:hypothetical protein
VSGRRPRHPRHRTGFEIDPNTVLQWLVEAAEQLQTFSAYFLHELHITQVQLDELYAVLSAVRHGTMSEAQALERLEHSPHWVWTAIDPESKLLLSVQGGERTLAMAQVVLHHIAQLLAPGCVPLFVSDGYAHYLTAIVTHFGCWVQPPRRWASGPTPKPRWMPRPELLYAQVVKTMRRRRLVAVKHRVVFGTQAAVEQVLAACGWQINTASLLLDSGVICSHVALESGLIFQPIEKEELPGREGDKKSC